MHQNKIMIPIVYNNVMACRSLVH